MSETLYRKYRPQVFDDIVGQEHIVRTLKNAIANNKVSHAYLFTGPRGTGKTTTARILAKALLCEHGPTDSPDGTCDSCKLIAESAHPDVSELDAASRTGVENVRDEIIANVNYAPVRGQYKVYIIDEVHMLSVAAFNALLKTLEEPPEHVVFILCTTDPQKVLQTIQSRCQRFDFRPIVAEELTGRLGAVCEMEGVSFEGEALDIIARKSNGGLRDALTFLEQAITFGNNNVTKEIVERMLGGSGGDQVVDVVETIEGHDVGRGLEVVNQLVEQGVDLGDFIDVLAQCFRDIYVVKLVGSDVEIEASPQRLEWIAEKGKSFTKENLEYYMRVLRDEGAALKRSGNQRLSFELTLFKLMHPEGDEAVDALAARVSELEKKLIAIEAGAPAPEIRTYYKKDFEEPEDPAPSETTPQGAAPAKEADAPSAPLNDTAAATPVIPSEARNHAPAAHPNPTTAKKGLWAQTMDVLRVDAPNIASLIGDIKPAKDGKKIIFNLGPDKGFTYMNLSKPATKQSIIAALEKVGLIGCEVIVTKDVPGDSSAAPQNDAVTPQSAPIAPSADLAMSKAEPIKPKDDAVTPQNDTALPQEETFCYSERSEESPVEEAPAPDDDDYADAHLESLANAIPQTIAEAPEDDEVFKFSQLASEYFGEDIKFEEVKK